MIGKKGGHMRKTIVVAVAAVSVLAAAGRVLAHHAFSAEFDAKKSLNLRGVVKKVEWINPHTWIHINVKNADGSTTEWMIEGGTPNTLLRRGIDRNSLPTGTAVVVDGYMAKSGANRANGRDLTLADGKKLFMGSSGTGAPADGRDPTGK